MLDCVVLHHCTPNFVTFWGEKVIMEYSSLLCFVTIMAVVSQSKQYLLTSRINKNLNTVHIIHYTNALMPHVAIIMLLW